MDYLDDEERRGGNAGEEKDVNRRLGASKIWRIKLHSFFSNSLSALFCEEVKKEKLQSFLL